MPGKLIEIIEEIGNLNAYLVFRLQVFVLKRESRIRDLLGHGLDYQIQESETDKRRQAVYQKRFPDLFI